MDEVIKLTDLLQRMRDWQTFTSQPQFLLWHEAIDELESALDRIKDQSHDD